VKLTSFTMARNMKSICTQVMCTLLHIPFFIFFLWWDWGLNSGLHICKVGTLSLKLFCSGYFGVGGGQDLINYLPRLASNQDPPGLSFPSS
jgi:hypothetical protein